ncbi:MAG: imelysin family protein [Polyangiales bacterium]|nr:iron-regulated protein [Myxococcales bacterium]
MTRTHLSALAALVSVSTAATLAQPGCSDGGGSFVWPEETPDAVATYAQIVEATYADTVAEAQLLDTALTAFVAAPTPLTLEAAREAWLASREPYLQSEVFRFYDGPIDNAEDGPEGLINAWPLDENYIDYVEGDPTAGIINGTETIDAPTLTSLNEEGGEKNIATGYHAIEFLLWGQDQSTTGPGDRSSDDYLVGSAATNQARRAQYLTVVGDLLVLHLRQVRDAWAPTASYRVAFEGDPEGSFANILTGMIILSGFETGGERLQPAIDSGDQEDEHSCFSDNTHRDMVQDVRGVSNVWHGRYTRVNGTTVSGTGVRDIVAAVDAELAAELDTRIATSLSLAEALMPPFDQEIVPGAPGNARVVALIQSLREQERLLSEVFETFQLSVPVPE